MTLTEKKNFNIFLITQIISSFAYNFILTVLSYQTLQLTASSKQFALSIIFNTIPKIFLLQLAGFLADKFNKKRLFVLTDIFYSLSLFLVFGTSFIYKNDVKVIFFASFMLGLLKAFSTPITKAIVPVIAPKDKLLKANSYEISNDKIARTIGPVISLFVFYIFGFKVSVFVVATLYALMALSKSFIFIENIEVKDKNYSFSFFTHMYKGIISIFRNRAIVFLLLNAITTQLLFHPFNYIVVPSIFRGLKESQINSSIIYYLLKVASFLEKGNVEKIWMNLPALVTLGGAFGTILSLYFLEKFNRRIKDRDGLTLAIIGKVVFGLALIALIFSYFYLKVISLTFLILALFFINLGLMFSFNLFTIFFANFYQKEIAKEELGKFIANFMVLFNLSGSLGSFIYGFSFDNSLSIPLILLSFGILLKIVLHMFFLSAIEQKEGK